MHTEAAALQEGHRCGRRLGLSNGLVSPDLEAVDVLEGRPRSSTAGAVAGPVLGRSACFPGRPLAATAATV